MSPDSPDTSIWRYPSVTEVLHSPLQPDEVLDRVKRSIRPELVWGIFHREPFQGQVEGNTFAVYTRSSNNKSASPKMCGIVQAVAHEPGSTLTVQYQERTIALVAHGVMGLVFVLFRVSAVVEGIVQQEASWFSLLLVPLSIIPVAILMFAAFRYRVWQSRRALAELLLLKKISVS